MKKIFTLCAFLFALMTCAAWADAKLPMVSYKCLICEKYFFSFVGDSLDTDEINDPDIQLKKVFKLSNRGENFPACSSNFKAHVFEKKTAGRKPISEVAQNMDRIAVIKDGSNLRGITLSMWHCLAPDCSSGRGPFYTLNDDSLMLRDWEQQIDKIISMKGGRKIPKCQSRWTWGHAFYRYKKDVPVKSYEIATIAYDLFYVKN